MLVEFLEEHLELLTESGGGGTLPEIKEFSLYSHDYLQFAGFELDHYNASDDEQRRVSHLINCVSNLKRALENQLDLLVHGYKLAQLFPGTKMNFPNKLKFAERCGFLEGRTFSRINKIRNSIEHGYEIPKIEEIDAFYDLVTAAICVLQEGLLLTLSSEAEFFVKSDDDEPGHFRVEFSANDLKAKAKWKLTKSAAEVGFETTDPDEFIYIVRVVHFLRRLHVSFSTLYIRSKLQLTSNAS